MTIREILKVKGHKVWTIFSDQTVQDALEILVTHKIGAVIVLDRRGFIVGILSEKDIVRGCFFESGDIEKIPVHKLMVRKVIVASADDEINSIMKSMTENRIRHIPVVEERRLIGIVSIGDVVKSLLQDSEHQIKYLKEFIYGSPGPDF